MQGNQLYQYRVILPVDDDKTVNVATDLDFNVEGEVKWGITPNLLMKSNFAVSTYFDALILRTLAVHAPLCSIDFPQRVVYQERVPLSFSRIYNV
jgi:hypothetical protein